jgi:hypothetical protein
MKEMMNDLTILISDKIKKINSWFSGSDSSPTLRSDRVWKPGRSLRDLRKGRIPGRSQALAGDQVKFDNIR